MMVNWDVTPLRLVDR